MGRVPSSRWNVWACRGRRSGSARSDFAVPCSRNGIIIWYDRSSMTNLDAKLMEISVILQRNLRAKFQASSMVEASSTNSVNTDQKQTCVSIVMPSLAANVRSTPRTIRAQWQRYNSWGQAQASLRDAAETWPALFSLCKRLFSVILKWVIVFRQQRKSSVNSLQCFASHFC